MKKDNIGINTSYGDGRSIMENICILVVEDDKEINYLIANYLRKEGYIVDCSFDGMEAINKFENKTYQLVILDLMLPKFNGGEVLLKIREKSTIPVIILSAKDEQTDKIFGLELGADDYIVKPFDIGEVIARVKAQLRRYLQFNNSNEIEKTEILKHGELQLNLDTYELKVGERHINLTAKEFEILKLLMTYPNKVFTKSQLFNAVWKEEYITDENTVMVHISRLRNKIESCSSNSKYIKTVWGIGYKLGEV
ncbi:DNA-binding response regulator, OmpR family, contains REC and winged-helix (wHTH) domain [Clostridium frigidicarnis]|uniref:Stage 0 sporulation protein A homolog n=2 Tax=Clostridium frigidicarnis TaxID=84698 RepID=A0A1I0Y4A6_9CLOT|nr:DNA-binding response regulator, OmpR family, contains REC and winged-helix (wHTH) domain [Clostridium frigidicarnis]